MVIIAGSVTAAGIAVGSIFGVRAFSLRHDSNERCYGGCDAEGVRLNDEGKRDANVSTVAFGAAVVAAGVGT